MTWTCPRCDRTFRQVNQRHACGVGNRDELLRDRPTELVELYDQLEEAMRSLGDVEVVTRDRYALFRTTRTFVDLAVMRDALRVVIHLDRQIEAPSLIKVVPGRRRTANVLKIRTPEDVRNITPFLRESYDLAVRDGS